MWSHLYAVLTSFVVVSLLASAVVQKAGDLARPVEANVDALAGT